MKELDQASNRPKQTFTVKIEDGSTFTMSIKYIEMQYGWFVENLTYGDFQINNMRICNSPNMFHQFRNKLPFGIACITSGNREPSFIEDFEEKESTLYLLTEEEVSEYEGFLRGEV